METRSPCPYSSHRWFALLVPPFGERAAHVTEFKGLCAW